MQFKAIANTYWRNIQQTQGEVDATAELSLLRISRRFWSKRGALRLRRDSHARTTSAGDRQARFRCEGAEWRVSRIH